MAVSDKIIESLKQLADALRSGERVMVTTIERCVCNDVGLLPVGPGSTKCHLCGGHGFIVDRRDLAKVTAKDLLDLLDARVRESSANGAPRIPESVGLRAMEVQLAAKRLLAAIDDLEDG